MAMVAADRTRVAQRNSHGRYLSLWIIKTGKNFRHYVHVESEPRARPSPSPTINSPELHSGRSKRQWPKRKKMQNLSINYWKWAGASVIVAICHIQFNWIRINKLWKIRQMNFSGSHLRSDWLIALKLNGNNFFMSRAKCNLPKDKSYRAFTGSVRDGKSPLHKRNYYFYGRWFIFSHKKRWRRPEPLSRSNEAYFWPAIIIQMKLSCLLKGKVITRTGDEWWLISEKY